MPATRRPRPVQPKCLAYNVGVATIALVLLMLPSSDSFGLMPVEQSTEFFALISTPAQTWLSSNLPLTAPPLSSLLSSSRLTTFTSSSNGHNTASSWSSLALPADLSYVCDEDDYCVMENEDAKVENHQERFVVEELLEKMPTKATLAAAAQSVISDAVDAQKSGSRIIHLTAEEQQLFQLLVDFRNECCPATTIRVAGGWVRDKLLAFQQDSGNNSNAANAAAGQPTFHASKDIDLVTSNISGQAFAYLLRGYLNKRQGLNANPFSFVEKKQDCDLEFSFPHLTYSRAEAFITSNNGISASSTSTTTSQQNYANTNPLQTASFQIAGFDIDVCHLRKDQYDGSSRVPTQTQLASAAEDAWRRDLTINSLFFNLHSNQIEDWTEHGLQDLLSQRKIATPKAPLPTLLQDPLRILRAIRFAAQFSFAMDPKLIKAARNPQVQSAINAKLSQTRRAKEMDAIFRTSNPSLGIGFLLDTDLLSALLPTSSSPSSEESSTDVDNIWEMGFLILLHTQRLASQVFVRMGDWKDVNRRFLWYAALLQPFYGQQLQRQAEQSRRSRSPLFDLLNSKLKLSKNDVQSIESIIRGLEAVPELLYLEEEDSITRKGLYENKEIQQAQRLAYYEALVKVGPLWKETMLLHLAIGCHKRDGSMSIEKAINVFKMLQSKIRNLGLDSSGGGNYDSIFGLHPLLTGSEIMNDTLPRLLQGKLFKEVMEEQKRWQVRHLDAIASQPNEQMVLKLRDHLQKCFPDYV